MNETMKNILEKMIKDYENASNMDCVCGIDTNSSEDRETADYLAENYLDPQVKLKDIICLEAMPVNKPMRAGELAEYLNNKYDMYTVYWGHFSPQGVAFSLYNYGDYLNITRETKREPYEYTTFTKDNKEITIKEIRDVFYWTKLA